MGVIVVGDRERACLACDTEMQAFGPVHVNYGARSAKGEMRDFVEWLGGDPRGHHRAGKLNDIYFEWKRDVLRNEMRESIR